MSLVLTIFTLVFVTELISWIGKSVLLHLVRFFVFLFSLIRSKPTPLLGVVPIPKHLQPECRESSATAQVGNLVKKGGVTSDQCARPICEVGQTSSECR